MTLLEILICVFLSYLIGSIPSGYLFFRWKKKKDIRNFGSQSIGATNILRTSGWTMALPVAALDILKGFLPTLLGLKLFADSRLALVFGFCAVFGHCFPVFIKFRGGKGVATAVGVYAAVAIVPLLFMLAVFMLVIVLTRYVSLGSILGALSFPLFVSVFKENRHILYLSIALFLLIVFKHRSNIQRLINGSERKFGDKAA
ncbi:MAG: glycerol-3-phosphate 1-O-acyltransferase PlsY [Candidatus Aminicenantes bacterium]|jgi:glycerol-3-phosphate acyltransferase PlsY